jgi:hypothetical protein
VLWRVLQIKYTLNPILEYMGRWQAWQRDLDVDNFIKLGG